MKKIGYRIFSLLATFFVLSQMLFGTLSWQNIGQQVVNEVQGGTKRMLVRLVKKEKKEDGTKTDLPVANAKFCLYTSDGKVIGEPYLTSAKGEIQFSLESGDYYLEEVVPPIGYIYDKQDGKEIKQIHFTVQEEDEELVLEAYNQKAAGQLTIEKQVNNVDQTPLTEQQKTQEFSFYISFFERTEDIPKLYEKELVYSIDNGTKQVYKSGTKVTLKQGQKLTFPSIPVGLVYEVVEKPELGYEIQSEYHTGVISETPSYVTFVNSYDKDHTQLDKGTLIVTKEVKGVVPEQDVSYPFVIKLGNKQFSFTLKNGEQKEFPSLDLGTIYEVKEQLVDGTYQALVDSYQGVIQGAETVTLPFVNFYDNPEEEIETSGSLTVEKSVLGEEIDATEQFTFQIQFDKGEGFEQPQTFVLQHGQQKKWENIPTGTKYRIEEIDSGTCKKITSTVSGSIGRGEHIIVPFYNQVQEKEKISYLQISKKILGTVPVGEKQREFVFQLLLDGEEQTFSLKDGESIKIPVKNGQQYQVIEELSEHYDVTMVNGYGTIPENGVHTIDVVVTNEYNNTPILTNIKGEKTWKISEDRADIKLPEFIEVQLKQQDNVVATKKVVADKEGKWHYEFTVPKYDKDGKEIVYTIEELPLSDFYPTYKGYDMINTPFDEVLFDPPLLEKRVEGLNELEAKKHKFSFVIEGLNNAPMPDGSIGQKKIVEIIGNGSTELGEIKYSKTGTYQYKVVEVDERETGFTYDKSSYTMTVIVTEEHGKLQVAFELVKNNILQNELLFVNSYEEVIDPTKEQVQIPVVKKWEHGNNEESKFPTAIIVTLYADGELYIQRQVTKTGDWSTIFDVPKYNKDGKEIVYTVDEEPVPFYKKSIDGYIITNTYTGEENNSSTEGKPSVPSTEGKPNVPSTEDKPSTEGKPSVPSTEDKPSTEGKPSVPSTEDKPSTEGKPNVPSTEDKPSTEEKPSVPSTEDKPSTEGKPNVPSTEDKPSTEGKPNVPSTEDKPSTEGKPSVPSTEDKPSTEGKPSMPSTEDKPSTEGKPNVPSTEDKPSTEGKPSVPSTEDKPSTEGKPNVPSTEGKPNVPSTEDKPSTEGKPNVPSTEGKPNVPSTEGKPSVPSTEDKPSTEGKPSVPSTEGKPSTEDKPSTEGKPNVPSTEDKPSTEGKPSVPSTEEKPSTEGKPNVPSTEGNSGTGGNGGTDDKLNGGGIVGTEDQSSTEKDSNKKNPNSESEMNNSLYLSQGREHDGLPEDEKNVSLQLSGQGQNTNQSDMVMDGTYQLNGQNIYSNDSGNSDDIDDGQNGGSYGNRPKTSDSFKGMLYLLLLIGSTTIILYRFKKK